MALVPFLTQFHTAHEMTLLSHRAAKFKQILCLLVFQDIPALFYDQPATELA